MAPVRRFVESCLCLAERLRWSPPLIARLFIGYLFMRSGWGKVHRIDWFTANFVHWGIPHAHFLARLTAYTELIAGAMVLAGFLTRAAAIALLIDMGVALATVQLKRVSDFYGFVSLHEPYYMVVFFWLTIEGAGTISLDWLIEKLGHLPGWAQLPVKSLPD